MVLGARPVSAAVSAVAVLPVSRGGGPVHGRDGAARAVRRSARGAVAEGDRRRGALGVDRAVEGRPVAVTLVAALVVAVGGSGQGREVEHRAVGGAGAADRLDLEVVLVPGARPVSGPSRWCSRCPSPWRGWTRSPWWRPEQFAERARGAVAEGDRGRGVLGVDRAVEGRSRSRDAGGRAGGGGRGRVVVKLSTEP